MMCYCPFLGSEVLTKLILPGCDAVQIGSQMPSFRKNLLLPSSVCKRSDKVTAFGDLTPCGLVEKYECFDRNCCHLLDHYTLKMEAVGSSTISIVRLSTKMRNVTLQQRIFLLALLSEPEISEIRSGIHCSALGTDYTQNATERTQSYFWQDCACPVSHFYVSTVGCATMNDATTNRFCQ